MKLSVVISAYNEEKNIKDCLESVKEIADEIVFVDNESTDDTVKIAKKYANKIYSRSNNPMLNVNKNFGFTKATGDWILNLDADERATTDLAKEIENLKLEIGNSDVAGYWIPRKNIIFGKWIQSEMWWPDYQMRLFRKGVGKFPEKDVHEYIKIEGKTEKLKSALIHKNYSSISQYIQKLDKIYTEDEAKRIYESKGNVGWIDALRFPVSDFLKTFFAQKGYRDGLHGLVLSLLQAFYAEVVFAKVWEKQGFFEENPKNFVYDFYKESRQIIHEFQYWFLTTIIHETKSGFKKTMYRILRKRVTMKLR